MLFHQMYWRLLNLEHKLKCYRIHLLLVRIRKIIFNSLLFFTKYTVDPETLKNSKNFKKLKSFNILKNFMKFKNIKKFKNFKNSWTYRKIFKITIINWYWAPKATPLPVIK